MVSRHFAEEIGENFNADYAFMEEDEHGTHTLVLKFGEFDEETDVQDFIEHMEQ